MTVEGRLRDFRLTPGTHDIPWESLRAVPVQQQHVESPNLEDMKALLSLLPRLHLSVKAIHDAPLFDTVHLLKVFQLVVQFSLWSQHVMYEQWQEEVRIPQRARNAGKPTTSEREEEPKTDEKRWRREAALRKVAKEERIGVPHVEGERDEEKEAMWEKYRLYYGTAHREEKHKKGKPHAFVDDRLHRYSDPTASSTSTSSAGFSSEMFSSSPETPLTPTTTTTIPTTASMTSTSSASSSLLYRLVKDREYAMGCVRELEDSLDQADDVISILREEVKKANEKYHRFHQCATKQLKEVIQALEDQRVAWTHAAMEQQQQVQQVQQQHAEEKREWKRKLKEHERETRKETPKKRKRDPSAQRRDWSEKHQWNGGNTVAPYTGGGGGPPPPPPPVVPSVPVTVIYLQRNSNGKKDRKGRRCVCCTCTCRKHQSETCERPSSHGTAGRAKTKPTTPLDTPEQASPPPPVFTPPSIAPMVVSDRPPMAAVPPHHAASPVGREATDPPCGGEEGGPRDTTTAPTAVVRPSSSFPTLSTASPPLPPAAREDSPRVMDSTGSTTVWSPDTRAVWTEMQKNILPLPSVVPHDASLGACPPPSLLRRQEEEEGGLASRLAVDGQFSPHASPVVLLPLAHHISPPPFLGVDRSQGYDTEGHHEEQERRWKGDERTTVERGIGAASKEEVVVVVVPPPHSFPPTTPTPLVPIPLAPPSLLPPPPPLLVPTVTPVLDDPSPSHAWPTPVGGGGGEKKEKEKDERGVPLPLTAHAPPPSSSSSSPLDEKILDTTIRKMAPETCDDASPRTADVSVVEKASSPPPPPPPPPPTDRPKEVLLPHPILTPTASDRRVSSPPSELANSYVSLTDPITSSASSLLSIKKSRPLPSFSVSSVLLSPTQHPSPTALSFPHTHTPRRIPPTSPVESNALLPPSTTRVGPKGPTEGVEGGSGQAAAGIPSHPIPIPVPIPVPTLPLPVVPAPASPPLPITKDLADSIPPPALSPSRMQEDMPAVSAQQSALLRSAEACDRDGASDPREDLQDVLQLSLPSTPVPSFPSPLPGEGTPLFLKSSTTSSRRSSASFPPPGRDGNTSTSGYRGMPLLPPRQAPRTASAAHRKEEKKESNALDSSTSRTVDCRHCGQALTSSTRHVHESNCEKRPVKCPKCRQSVTASELPDHLCDLSLLFGSKSSSIHPSSSPSDAPPPESTRRTTSTLPSSSRLQSTGAEVENGNAFASHTVRSQAVKSGRRKADGDGEAASVGDRLNASTKLRGSSILLQETQRELQALLEEEAAEEARKGKS